MADAQMNPITLLIIDDIPSVVEGLAQQIPWTEYGIKVVGTANNGEQGLELLRQALPDIVLTDIRMPRLDGIDMARRMFQYHSACKFDIHDRLCRF
ncbi:response regulator [Paenibacillus sp. BIHB 4019]|uniref:response regulator n=1 Tax=Paenibacillus sp. BIHB 4019 TaxID=1870819 RepID=UPI000C14F7B1|nr:response regulator [Paenibacillus sp. BIHB 4019]